MVRGMIYRSPDLPEHGRYHGRGGPRQQNRLLVASVWRMPTRKSSLGSLRAFPAVGGRNEQKARGEDKRLKWGLSRMSVLSGWLICLVSPKDRCTCPIWTTDPLSSSQIHFEVKQQRSSPHDSSLPAENPPPLYFYLCLSKRAKWFYFGWRQWAKKDIYFLFAGWRNSILFSS